MGAGLRYFGGALAFGFAAVWIVQSLAAAFVCVAAAAAGYGGVLVAQRTSARLGGPGGPTTGKPSAASRAGDAADLSRRADELNDDLGHVYEPEAIAPSSADSAEAARSDA